MTINSELMIRSATLDDIDFLIPRVVESSGGVWPAIWNSIKAETESELEMGKKYMSDSTNKLSVENTVVGEMKGKLRAAMIIYNERTDNLDASEKYSMPAKLVQALSPYAELSDSDSLFISELCTAPQARGKGVGTRMLEYSKEMAKKHGYTSITLRVFSGNVQAIKLYKRFGFRSVDRRPVLHYPGIVATGEVILMRYTPELSKSA